jgi:N-acetyl-anhydromuramyl-L-alanine amidase AmpD
MREINLLVIHCSATPEGLDIGAKELRVMHLARGFADIGYHYVIRLDGSVEKGRADDVIGAHAEGYNAHSLGICMVGGLDHARAAKDTFTPAQWATLKTLVNRLTEKYAIGKIVGHRDLSPDLNHDGKITPNEWMKQCPCFDVREWLAREHITGIPA